MGTRRRPAHEEGGFLYRPTPWWAEPFVTGLTTGVVVSLMLTVVLR